MANVELPSLSPVRVLQSGTEELTTRDRIVEVAARLFHQHGYHATTMRQIADGVGIKAASLYNHFAGKQELLYTISYDTMCEMLASVQKALAGVHEPDEQLRAFVRAHTTYCIVERYRARVADELRDLYPENLLEVVAMRDRYEAVLRGILAALDASSGGAVGDVTLVANAIGTMASQVATWYRDDGRLGPDEIAGLYAELALGAALAGVTQTKARPHRR
ncbi:MAG: TetR/AcrR family transcriptional regulator [Acidimicrobiales bacterium]